MLFGIDFDHTFSEDPEFFHAFLDLIEEHGHRAIIVTARIKNRSNQELIEEVIKNRIDIVFSELGSKFDAVDRDGYEVDIWIDDSPEKIATGYIEALE